MLDRLYHAGVSSAYVGDPTDALSAHWSAEVNAKTQRFWVYRSFIDRLSTTAEAYGITVAVQSEAHTTAECPACGEREQTDRPDFAFWCHCGYAVWPMVRPVRLTWDNHDGRPTIPARW